jgi:hypothetical protein
MDLCGYRVFPNASSLTENSALDMAVTLARPVQLPA